MWSTVLALALSIPIAAVRENPLKGITHLERAGFVMKDGDVVTYVLKQ
jgi:hypothetical protein